MLPTISLGPIVLPTSPLVTIAGIWLALLAVEKAAERLGLNASRTYNLAALALLCGFVVARAAFVAAHWTAYRQNLLGIIWPLTGGYTVWVGLFVAFWAAFFYGRAHRLPAGDTLDALAPGLLMGAATLSVADFLAGPGYGKEADLPWSIVLFGISRHPVQIYELGVALAAIALWLLAQPQRSFSGQLFLLAAIVFSAGRLVVDAYRADALLTADGYHILQIGALAVLILAMTLLMLRTPAIEPGDEARTD